jgi:glycosyltransferase involved in cell wall biosynthesis
VNIVFLITRGDAVGGATVHVRDMARALIANGDSATVLVGGAGEVLDEFARSGVPYRSMPSLRRSIHPSRDIAALREIIQALHKLQPDLVSTHTAKAGWLGRIACRVLGIPVLFTAHGWAISDRISRAGGRVFRMVERIAAPMAETIVNVCEAEKRLAELARIAPPGKLTVIHNGVQDVPVSQRATPETDPPRLVMVARFEPPKDPGVLLRALATLRQRPWELELVGAGPRQARVRRLAAELGLEQRVHFSGGTTNVAQRLSNSQIFVLASNSEGFPRSILEAMRSGLPVVASDVGGVREAVIQGETGFVVPRHNAGGLAKALSILLDNPELRLRFGRAGRRRYENNFTFDIMLAKTLALYDRILAAQPVAARASSSVPATGQSADLKSYWAKEAS